MKSSFLKEFREFRQFRTKIILRTLVLMLISVISIYACYSFILHGHFANAVVFFFQHIFRTDYQSALKLYERVFRSNTEFFVLLAVLAMFAALLYIYLGWFTRYFMEINRGMDGLTRQGGGEISLSPELFPLERKMNFARHTIERQKAEMYTAERRKNDLVMYLAHDLKTPLASVIGYLNLLCDEKQISPQLRDKYLAIALDKAQRLEDLINEFFEIAKFSLSDITLQYSRINLTRLLEQTIYEFGPMLDEKSLRCTLEVESDIMLRCDADKIQRVFDNLLRNAVMYSFCETEIRIVARCGSDYVTVRFVNHGNTIPEEKLERIFEQFYRLDTGRGTESGGSGLGLAIARQITRLHGGNIAAESSDEVTVFTVVLPVKQESGQQAEQESDPPVKQEDGGMTAAGPADRSVGKS